MKRCLPALLASLALFVYSTRVSAQTYNIYYGDIHSHTWYSDGNQDQVPSTYTLPVARGMTFAKSSPSMNFLGISDHNHGGATSGFPMTLPLWRSGHHEADSVNQDGVFAALYGQEWGVINNGGHVLIYGTDRLFGWDPGIYDVFVTKSNYTMLWDSVKKYNGYAYLAHPQLGDYGGIFTGAYNAKADSVIQGVAMKNGPSTSTNLVEGDPSATDYTARYHDLLRLGYHVAPCANQDNHNTTYGRANQQRTAVIATSLTRANIDDALRNRRAYATEDHNLQLRLESGTHQMGEIFTTGSPVALRVKAVDAGESFSRIEIRYGIPGSGVAPTTLASTMGPDSLVLSQAQPNGTTYYYYAYVLEADGQEAWSAPVWVTTSTLPPPGVFTLSSPSNGATGIAPSGSLSWGASSGATGYDVYLGTANPPVIMVSSNQAGTSYAYAGLVSGTPYFWKVVARNASGTTTGTGAPWNFTTVVISPGPFALTSPPDGAVLQPLSGTLRWASSANALGYDVYLGTADPPVTIVSANQTDTTYAYGGLANNTPYFWKVVAKNGAQSTSSTPGKAGFTTVLNAPGSFVQSSPANAQTHVPLSGNLTWQTSANATGYNVYFGAVNPPPLVSFNQAATSFSYGPLSLNTLYYWKIVARNATDTTTATGAPWNFTTIAPPDSFHLLTPISGATGQPLDGTLTWEASNQATSYDLYLDVVTPPTAKLDSNLVGTNYSYALLQPNTVYYWKAVAKNVDGTRTAANAPFQFTTVNVPAGPTGLFISGESATNLTLHWTDNASNESGYRVYRSFLADGPYAQLGPDLPIGTQLFGDTGLSADEHYYYHVLAFNLDGEGSYGAVDGHTLANVPGPPLVSTPGGPSANVVVNPAGNPPGTRFAIRAAFDTVVAYVQQNGSLLPTPDWRTYAEWGTTAGVLASGLQNCKLYAFDVKARNGNDVQTAFGPSASQQVSCYALTGTVAPGWNLLSVPVYASSYLRQDLFPSSISSAFRYAHAYVRTDTMSRGRGFWLKFASADSVSIPGGSSPADTFDLAQGWNIIGSVSTPVAIGAVVQQPGGILSSNYFGYNGAYVIADSLHPMLGYWVKANTPGRIIISSSSAQPKTTFMLPAPPAALSSFTFEDRSGFRRTLYIDEQQSSSGGFDLPPAAPEGAFDVRFASETYRASYRGTGRQEFPISLQSTSYPVTISWSLAPGHPHYRITAGTTTEELAPSGTLTLERALERITLVAGALNGTSARPQAYALRQNYPNPFNPSTEIRYDLPIASQVRLTVFNALGVTVATLVEQPQVEGEYRITWSPEAASGVYFYRLEAASLDNPSHSYQSVLRAIYLK